MRTKIVAIDGCGGAGKSTLAAHLSKYLGHCPVIHTDDFASWDQPLDWFPRMLDQVLTPLKQNQTASFQRYDWSKRQFDNWIQVEPQDFIIVEGVSATRIEFRPSLAFSIFVSTDRSLRLQRGLERDGKDAETQWLEWMRQEDEYVLRNQPENFVDLILSGDEQHGSEQEFVSLGGKVMA